MHNKSGDNQHNYNNIDDYCSYEPSVVWPLEYEIGRLIFEGYDGVDAG